MARGIIGIIMIAGGLALAWLFTGPGGTDPDRNGGRPVDRAGYPERILLIPDDYHLRHVGRLADGRQYWIDVQLLSDPRTRVTRDFVCLYVFDAAGGLEMHEIHALGPRTPDQPAASAVIAELLQSLPGTRASEIRVRPFSVEHDGQVFGLVVRDTGSDYVVDAWPGMTLMFYAPWPDGGYDT